MTWSGVPDMIFRMARIARVVVPGIAHHVIQRGVRSMPVFDSDGDRHLYLSLLREQGLRKGLRFWAWTLMTNHIHLVVVPAEEDSLARAIGETHRRYTRFINDRESVRGHLFQERFHSFPVQTENHLVALVRYVEVNSVRAGLSRTAESYRWSSARHHVSGVRDPLVTESPIRKMVPHWKEFLRAFEPADGEAVRSAIRTGRPLGTPSWIERMEKNLGRALLPQKRGWRAGRSRSA